MNKNKKLNQNKKIVIYNNIIVLFLLIDKFSYISQNYLY